LARTLNQEPTASRNSSFSPRRSGRTDWMASGVAQSWASGTATKNSSGTATSGVRASATCASLWRDVAGICGLRPHSADPARISTAAHAAWSQIFTIGAPLFRQALQRLHKSTDMPVHLPRPYRYLSFRIAAPLPLDLEFKQQILPIRNETERLRRVTRVIAQLITQLDFVQKARSKAGGNGNLHPQG